MINIVKEIKINILNSVKFLMRVCKRGTMFAFTLSICIVLALSMHYLDQSAGCRLVMFECSAIVCLTCIFLYLVDFIKAIKKFFKHLEEKRKFKRYAKTLPKVTITSK
jgi:hypothetical protein